MRYVIVGNGMAGITAAGNIRRLDTGAHITIVTDEESPFYSRPGLMYYMMGTLKEWDFLLYKNDSYYKQLGVEIKYARALRIERDIDRLELSLGEKVPFDRLLLATGSKSRPLVVPGSDLDGIHYMYSLTDCRKIMGESCKGKKAAVIGGGLLGAELAEVWRYFGLEVVFLALEPWYFPKGLSEPQGRLVESAIRRHGCELHMGEEAAEFEGDSHVSLVVTKSGKEFEIDIAGVTIGVVPNTDIAVSSGISVNRGILVDSNFRTNRPNVFAAGDCAEIKVACPDHALVEQLWYSADRQGQDVARNMCGDTIPYDPGIFHNSAKFFDVDYVSVGLGRYANDGQEEETVISRNGRAARRFITRNSLVTGITSIGANDDPAVLIELIANGINLGDAKRRMG